MQNPIAFREMTLNERLARIGLSERFIEAGRRRDRNAIIECLNRLDIAPQQAEWMVNTMLASPDFYFEPAKQNDRFPQCY
jgi:hypothetical protein